VQWEPNGCLDLWAREHSKSTIITFALTIQDILASHGEGALADEELAAGIFSHTRPIAKAFLRKIMQELERNALLKELFPDVLWSDPRRQSPKWSEDEGFQVIRRNNRNEQTVEAWGLVDGQPTSKHYNLLIYDDVVTRESVTTPDQIAKTTDALELSYSLGARGGRRRLIGTRYRANDTYQSLLERKLYVARIHPATDDGTVDGNPVLMSPEEWARKKEEVSPYILACQQLQNPRAAAVDGFDREWLRFWKHEPQGTNKYLLVDPANSKRKGSDYTAVFVLGLGADRNYYVHELYRDRLSLTERTDLVFRLHRQHQPVAVGYERYGMQADLEHIEDRMERENYRFNLIALGQPRRMGNRRDGSKVMSRQESKDDRIRKLTPLFKSGRVWLPVSFYAADYEGVRKDMVQVFINEEYLPWPVGIHPDMLDAMARVLDDELNAVFPSETHSSVPRVRRSSHWMTT
jgi:phage terminase large subunit-like protein